MLERKISDDLLEWKRSGITPEILRKLVEGLR